MRRIALVFLRVAVVFLGFVASCNYDTGECYLRGQDGAGAGGSVIVQPGTGGFGDAPTPKPLGDPNYPTDPCMQQAECTVTWKVGSDGCNAAGDPGCTNLHRGHYATLEDAKKDCEKIYGINPPTGSGALSCDGCKWVTSATNDCLEHCKDQCVTTWEGCYDKCGKDHVCKEKCMNELIACNKKCEEKCK